MRLYKRDLSVIIGSDISEVLIKDLYIVVEIKKEAQSTPAEGTVRIYNLNETNETLVRTKGERIRIIGGYEGGTGLLFDGDIRKVERDRESTDRITTITLGGNVEKLTQATFIRSYEGQVRIRDIVQDIVPSFALGIEGLSGIPSGFVTNDFAWSGRSADALTRLLEPIGVLWYEDGGIISFSIEGVVGPDVAYVLRSGTGLIGSPSVTDKGVKARVLMNPRITVNSRVQIISDVLQRSAQGDAQNARAAESQGFYKVTQVLHKGDNRDGEYVTEILAVDINEQS